MNHSAPKHTLLNLIVSLPLILLISLGLYGFVFFKDISEFNQARVLELTLLAWLSLSFLLPRVRTQITLSIGTIHPALVLTTSLFWALGLVACLRAPWPSYAFLDWGHYLLIALCVLVAGALFSLNINRATRMLLAGIAFGISLVLARFIIQLILTFSLGIFTPLNEWWLPYLNPRFFAQTLVWILPLLTVLPVVWPLYHKRRQLAAHAICIGTWMLLFWTGSRAELLSLFLGMLIVGCLIRQPAFFLVSRMAGHALTGLALQFVTRSLVIWWSTHLSSTNLYMASGKNLSALRTGSSGRDWLVERSLALIAQNPWLGVGPAHFSIYNNNTEIRQISAHPHNLILQLAVEWGVPAALLFLLLAWAFWRRQYRTTANQILRHAPATNLQYHLKIALLLTLLAACFTSLLDGIHLMPLSLLVGIPVLGLMVGTTSKAADRQARSPITVVTIGGLLILGWACVLQNISQNTDCLTYPVKAQQILKKPVIEEAPRFWLQGRIPYAEGCLEQGRYINNKDTLRPTLPEADAVDASSATEQYWR